MIDWIVAHETLLFGSGLILTVIGAMWRLGFLHGTAVAELKGMRQDFAVFTKQIGSALERIEHRQSRDGQRLSTLEGRVEQMGKDD